MQDRYLMFFIAVVLLFFIVIPSSFSQDRATETYSKVRVMVQAPGDIQMLQNNDITVEEHQGSLKEGIILVLNQREMASLAATGLHYEILIADLNDYYRSRPPITQQDLEKARRIQQADNVSGFGYGSMGGFYTYDEIAAELDSMKLMYPNIITAKASIGVTEQGRDIWMAKISDNPDLDESNTEAAIYYDAMHHAREPAAMAVAMYYMYWLLENYGSDPEATYLVDNREIFFVPIVNPDGYVYNQTTHPNGGGMWRKNRRNNSGSSCFGVDLNRNYSFGWGDPSGSSGDPCSDTYRGSAPFSEPETQAVRDLILAVNPAIAFSLHSVAGRYLNPYGYTSFSPDYDIYSEFASDFAAVNQYLYGRTSEMLGYFSSGTTRDYLHSEGTYAWTPEVSGSDFWPFQSEIIPIVSENLYAMKYLSWVGGAFADFQNYKILGDGYVGATDTLKLGITVKNRGLRMSAKQVMVDVTTDYPYAVPLVTSINYDSISARQFKDNFSEPVQFLITNSASFLDVIPLFVTISQEGVVTSRDTITVTVGQITELFSDDAENGKANWTASGTQPQWDTTYVGFYSEYHAFADSRYGNSGNNANTYFTLNQNVDLTQSLNPRLEFWAKWAIEAGYDYTRVQISTNNGSTWTTLAGKYTQIFAGQPSYFGIKHWVKEEINLSAYAGQQVKFRFYMYTDGGLVGDGFYFDDFKVLDFEEIIVDIGNKPETLPLKFMLAQNYPNPFNPNTVIRYAIPNPEKVEIAIYNALGQKVKTLVDENKEAGYFEAVWDATNDFGEKVSNGIYFYKVVAGDFRSAKKMVLLR